MELYDLNAKIDQLVQAAGKLSSVLRDMKREYDQMLHQPGTQDSADWIADALQSIEKYRLELLKAAHNQDPYNVSFAANQLVALNRFFADVSKEWSTQAQLFNDAFERTFKVAREIAFGIKRLDPSSLEAARRQLQQRSETA